MQVLPIDLTALVATILGISIVLIPVLGLTARFALKPVAEALARFLDQRDSGESVALLQRRIELQDRRIESLESAVHALSQAQDFDRQLLEQSARSAPSGTGAAALRAAEDADPFGGSGSPDPVDPA